MLDLIKQSLDAFATSDWAAFKATVAPDILYEEVATRRRANSVDALIALDKGWKAGSLPASGKSVKVGAVLIHKIKDGKIAELRHYFDLFGMLTALGVPLGPTSTPKAERVVH